MKKLDERLEEDAKIEPADVAHRVEIALRDGQKRVKARKKELEETYSQQIDDINNKLDAKIQKLQGWYMFLAVVLPPIAPLCWPALSLWPAAPRARRRQQVAAALKIS